MREIWAMELPGVTVPSTFFVEYGQRDFVALVNDRSGLAAAIICAA